MTKREIAQAMKEIAFFLRLKDDNPYRARAYERAGQALLLCPDAVAELVARNRLTAVDGIGPATAAAMTELFTTGASTLLRELRGDYPSTLVELGEVPGLSMKQILKLYEHAGIRSVAELREACLSNRLLAIRGIGEKIQARILTALGEYAKGRGYRLYADVLDEVAALADSLRAVPGVQSVSVAGDVRRKLEVVDNYAFVVNSSPASAPRLIGRLATAPNVTDAAAHEGAQLTATSSTGMPITIRVTTDADYGFDLLLATGSAEHLEGLFERFKTTRLQTWEAARAGFTGMNEPAIYGAAGLPYLPPELREGRGELDVTGRESPSLLEPSQIQGVFHLHTDYSDGAGTVEEMVRAARDTGYRYLGISDHSQSAFYANGLKEPRIRRQWAEIDAVQRRYPDIHIFKGIEADILADGSLDYPDALLAEFDFVIASVHSRFNLPEADQTRRVCRALAHPSVTMLGHRPAGSCSPGPATVSIWRG